MVFAINYSSQEQFTALFLEYNDRILVTKPFEGTWIIPATKITEPDVAASLLESLQNQTGLTLPVSQLCYHGFYETPRDNTLNKANCFFHLYRAQLGEPPAVMLSEHKWISKYAFSQEIASDWQSSSFKIVYKNLFWQRVAHTFRYYKGEQTLYFERSLTMISHNTEESRQIAKVYGMNYLAIQEEISDIQLDINDRKLDLCLSIESGNNQIFIKGLNTDNILYLNKKSFPEEKMHSIHQHVQKYLDKKHAEGNISCFIS